MLESRWLQSTQQAPLAEGQPAIDLPKHPLLAARLREGLIGWNSPKTEAFLASLKRKLKGALKPPPLFRLQLVRKEGKGVWASLRYWGKLAHQGILRLAFSAKLALTQAKSWVIGTLIEKGFKLGPMQKLQWQHSQLSLKVKNQAQVSLPQTIDSYKYLIPTPKNGKAFEIILTGDAGNVDASTYYNVEAMRRYFANPDALIRLGDMVYANNSLSESAARLPAGSPKSFHSALKAMWRPFLKDKIPVFDILGNNDIGRKELKSGFGEHFLNYTGSKRYYQIQLGNAAGGKGGADLFVLDLTLFGNDYITAAKLSSDPRVQQNAYLEQQKQLAWLRHQLEEARRERPFSKIMVLNHYPLLPAEHSNTAGHIEERLFQLKELLEEFNVSLSLHGHVHHYRRSEGTHIRKANGEMQKLASPLVEIGAGNGSPSHIEIPNRFASTLDGKWSQAYFSQATPTSIAVQQLQSQQFAPGFLAMRLDPTAQELEIQSLMPPLSLEATYAGHRIMAGPSFTEQDATSLYFLLDSYRETLQEAMPRPPVSKPAAP